VSHHDIYLAYRNSSASYRESREKLTGMMSICEDYSPDRGGTPAVVAHPGLLPLADVGDGVERGGAHDLFEVQPPAEADATEQGPRRPLVKLVSPDISSSAVIPTLPAGSSTSVMPTPPAG
jgi:hypothetical protein